MSNDATVNMTFGFIGRSGCNGSAIGEPYERARNGFSRMDEMQSRVASYARLGAQSLTNARQLQRPLGR